MKKALGGIGYCADLQSASLNASTAGELKKEKRQNISSVVSLFLKVIPAGLTRCARLSLGVLGNAQQESRTLYDYFCYK